jgi:tungstate transport system substrate-binding protein
LPPLGPHLRAAAMTAARTEWSCGCGNQRDSLRIKPALGIATWVRAWGRPSTWPPGSTHYTLTDRATWANFKNRQDLEILTEGDPALFNPYGSLVNPAKWPHMKAAEAKTWHEWLTSKAGLDAITSYRIDGEQLFFPPRGARSH